jgi:hypothetical protein
MAQESTKPFGGIIESWCVHDVRDHLPVDFIVQQLEKDSSFSPRFFTGSVVDDRLGRWKPGAAMRSSLIISLDIDTLTVETQNTCYKLQGPGRFSSERPASYDIEVGKTIMLTSDGYKLTPEDLDMNTFLFPETR